jgi:cobalt-zinc-cadmium efflux system protein
MRLLFTFIKKNSTHIRFGVAIFSNAAFTIAQVIYAHQAHSVSLLSDALHNLGDVLGLFIAWGAQVLAYSIRYPSRYTYGYRQSPILAAFINALLLLFSVSIIVRETIIKLSHSEAMNEMQVLFIATLGIIINGLTALLFLKDKDRDINMKAAFLHLMLDALTSFGVVISALVVYYGGYQWVDPLMALLIAAVICISGWQLLRNSLGLLLSAVPPHINLVAVNQYLEQLPGVVLVKKLHVWALGIECAALTAHLTLNDSAQTLDYTTINRELAEQYKITEITLQVMSASQTKQKEEHE